MPAFFASKLERLAGGNKPRILDLFAGCGGISLGFQSAGFSVVGSVEWDPEAAASHAANFCRALPSGEFELHARARDIRTEEPRDLVRALKLGRLANAVDVIVGGPPCQAFARVGRSKLREVYEHPEAFLNDPRSNLYLRYLDYVKALKPLAILMENVPDFLNYGGHNIAQEVCEVLEPLGYVAAYTLLNAANYGVPQMRERAFLIAYRREIASEVVFPKPSHWVDFPSGYSGTRSVALKTVTPDLFSGDFHHVETPAAHRGLPSAITAEQALGDLPKLISHKNGGSTRGARRFDTLLEYPSDRPVSDYAMKMRDWRGFSSKEGVRDHVIRHLPRDYPIFARMKPGDQYPEAYRLAHVMRDERVAREEAESGRSIKPGSRRFVEITRSIVPPYDPGKFPNKWRKMEADKPARTLMAHIGKDSYTHIHYDDEQSRTISVREAARLQSFPDGFEFKGTMNPAFRQIGNAVPPLHAKAIAREIKRVLRRAIR